MAYLPPYSTLKEGIGVSPDGSLVVMSRDLFRMFVASAARAARFDATWYRTEYPDVQAAIDCGDLGNELDHFAAFGYEEGRAPARMSVEEPWYREIYQDVDEAIRDGLIASAEDHYNEIGYREGRAADSGSENEVRRWQEAIAQSEELVHPPGGGAAAAWAAWPEGQALGAEV